MDKTLKDTNSTKEYVPHHVMEPGPLADKKLTGTWKDYVSVTKIGIITGNMIPVIAAMVLAAGGLGGFFQLPMLTIVCTLLGTTFIIASGTCLNNFYDRDIDEKMSRTKNRALVEGRLNPKNVLIMGFIFAIIGTIMLLFVNVLTTIVALTGLFFYAVVYTMWVKRAHHINTIVGSISGAIPPVIGWTAVTASLDVAAWVLFVIMFLWQPPHFLAIAMRRCEDYRNAGVPMYPVVKGFEATKHLIVLYVAALVPASLYLFLVTPIGVAYVGLSLALGLGWIIVSLSGYLRKKADDVQWARRNFTYSLAYLTLLFGGIIFI